MILDKKCCRKGVENLCDEIKNPGGYTKQTLAYHPGVVKFRSDPWLGLNLKWSQETNGIFFRKGHVMRWNPSLHLKLNLPSSTLGKYLCMQNNSSLQRFVVCVCVGGGGGLMFYK